MKYKFIYKLILTFTFYRNKLISNLIVEVLNMNVVMVFTSKPLETMIDEGGSGYWSASKKRLEKCSYLIATKSNTLREHFPSDTNIKQGSAFIVGKITNIGNSPKGDRLVIQISEFAEINIPNVWTGNRNPVAYTNTESLKSDHGLDFADLEWSDFPINEITPIVNVKALTIDEAKEGIAKTLGIDPSCIEILIKA